MPSNRSFFASRSNMAKKMAKRVGARTQPYFTPFSMGNELENSPLGFTCPCWPVCMLTWLTDYPN